MFNAYPMQQKQPYFKENCELCSHLVSVRVNDYGPSLDNQRNT